MPSQREISAVPLFAVPLEMRDSTPKEDGPAVTMWLTLPALVESIRKVNGIKLLVDSEANRIFEDAEVQAGGIRDQAELDAQAIIAEAHESAGAVRSDAFVEGYANGLTVAREEVAAEYAAKFDQRIATITESLDEMVALIIQERAELWQSMEHEITEFSLDIARKVIKTEISQNPKVLEGVVKDALRRVTDRTSVRILINPDELTHARACREDFMLALDGVRNIEIDADRRIGKGGCTIETTAGSIDAKIDTQIQQVVQALKQ